MFYVYVLKSATAGRRYVGSCQNIGERVRRHNAGHSKATLHGIPWKLLQRETFLTRQEAVTRERYYKKLVAVATNSIVYQVRQRTDSPWRAELQPDLGPN
jgi:putative endonuclease